MAGELARRLLCLLAAVVVVAGCSSGGDAPSEPLNLPAQVLLKASMQRKPVAGWTASVRDLGLPERTVLRPVGAMEDRGIFIAFRENESWLVGVDLDNGAGLFTPVRLGSTADGADISCVINAPPSVLCVRQADRPEADSHAWVIKGDSGMVTFEGASELRVTGERELARLDHVGDHAIATVSGKGIYGIGPTAELTWFVPGNGILPAQFAGWDRDTQPSRLLVQRSSDGSADIVFSVVDGHVVVPQLPPGVQLHRAMVYPDGFGYEYRRSDGAESIAFFDESGALLSDMAEKGTLQTRSVDLPAVSTSLADLAVALNGRRLVSLPPAVPDVEARLIGSRLFLAVDPEHRNWQQFDLSTGETGKTCVTDALGFYYLASDGDVAVALGDETPARAVDLTTCETLWSLPGSDADVAREVWKVGDILVEREGSQLSSLVAPA